MAILLFKRVWCRAGCYTDQTGTVGATKMPGRKTSMKISLYFFFFLLVIPTMRVAVADPMQDEIHHLLDFVASTQCRYERNGKSYDGEEAVKHIRRKYRYFRKQIDSTEKFIELSATKSTMSGSYYMIHCDDGPGVRSQQWLLDELQDFRAR